MFKINIDKILKDKCKSRFWLSKAADITYPTMKKLADGNTVSINFDVLYKICKALDCTPNDIFLEKED